MNRHAVPNALRPLRGDIKNGGSNPRFYEFDDGVARLVKWHPSSQGAKVCFNELVGSRLAQLIDAPLLRGDVVFVDDAIIPSDQRAFAKAGFNFGVFRMRGGNFVPAIHYPTINNTSSLPFAAVLLAWLQVADQQTHNQYRQEVVEEHQDGTTTKNYLFRLADMGFLFGLHAGNWTGSALPAQASYALQKHLADKVTADQLTPIIDSVLSLAESEVRLCFEDVPPEWGVAQDDVTAAADWVVAARPKIKSVITAGNPQLKFAP